MLFNGLSNTCITIRMIPDSLYLYIHVVVPCYFDNASYLPKLFIVCLMSPEKSITYTNTRMDFFTYIPYNKQSNNFFLYSFTIFQVLKYSKDHNVVLPGINL